MAIETKICTRCSKEKEITSFEKRNNNHYYRRRCNECHSQREEKARKKREKWEKIKKQPEKLKGSFKKYYSFFCDIRECGATKNYVISKLKNEFKLNKNYATQLADQFESGNIEKIILDYADPS